MKQKQIWLADLNPVKGQEQKGKRPVLIISGNAMNDHLGIVIACPLTTQVKKFAGCLVLQPEKDNGLKNKSEVLTFQIRTIDKDRLIHQIGTITDQQLEVVISGLNDILRY
ncbi:MAG: type II toxin-antitoxin system PemK/MazF family toxin [Saprospiraceae bacterium]|nr:type II toxin-antitoxin system PemK/MazF family toxin [Lewinella sp.]